jgi:hypothetical protein
MNKKDKIEARKAIFDIHLSIYYKYFCILKYGHYKL